ncbi:MAG: RNA polymerase sigma factor (sigma-70 family) [Planctomycetota bacterium]|jgi:RNA polymerase sigma factor (sigma-70 family)
MQAIDNASGSAMLSGAGLAKRLQERLPELRSEVAIQELERMKLLVADATRSPESLRDALSTRLMECFRSHESKRCFGLLYELNSQHLIAQVTSRLRRYANKADPNDILQEVFFNVYRYPHRFNCEREDAFRVWSAMIVRNTVLKHLRSQGRGGRVEVPFEDLSDQPATSAVSPLGGVIEAESSAECKRVYLTYLQLYLEFFQMLSERERRALHLVEVENESYRVAAEDLGIKLENLKMVIFRARRKIHRAMRRVFDGLPPDCRPARDPRVSKVTARVDAPNSTSALPQGSEANTDHRSQAALSPERPSQNEEGLR